MGRTSTSIMVVGCLLGLVASACASGEPTPQAAKRSGESAGAVRPAATEAPPVIRENVPDGPVDPAQPGDAQPPESYEYELYTHCGVEFARFKGRWWRTERLTDEGGASPPRGWGDPSQLGTMTLQSDDEAVFHDDQGHEVIFHPANKRRPSTCD